MRDDQRIHRSHTLNLNRTPNVGRRTHAVEHTVKSAEAQGDTNTDTDVSALPHLFILPGLDGTGDAFQTLIRLLEQHYQIHALRYPRHLELGYTELKRVLSRYIQHHLPPNARYYLLGASFSGPLAIELAYEAEQQNPHESQHQLLGLILVTTFARNPFPLLHRLSHHIESIPIEPSAKIVNRIVTGFFKRTPKKKDKEQTKQDKASTKTPQGTGNNLSHLHPNTMRKRVQSVLQVDATPILRSIRCPILYLQAQHDKLISSRAMTAIREYAPHTQEAQLPCGHFLLQEMPQAAAEHIQRFTTNCEAGRGRASSFIPLSHTALNR